MNASNTGGRNSTAALRQNRQKPDTAELRPVRSADVAAIEGLLESSGLPVDGVREDRGHFFVYLEGGTLLGAVGLELYGTAGLLRSTAVAASARKRGIATALIERAVAHAREQGCQAVYLLTLDAERYFQRFGFAVIGRDDAPKAVQGSPEFTALCPASALLMRKLLE